jgi:hypothetical protein
MVRGNLEGLLRAAAERHGIESRVARPDGQPWNHTEIFGGPVTLTAATVSEPGGMVRASDYKCGLASSGQERLFELPGAVCPIDPRYYAILAHSRYRGTASEIQKNGHLPGSVYMVWPASDCIFYVHSINLMDRFPEVARKYIPMEWDEAATLKYFREARRFGLAV